MTLLASETFTGANGAAWPAQWDSSAFTATQPDIQGNRGRIRSGSTAYSYSRAYLSGMAPATDTDVVATFTFGAQTESYIFVGVNCTNTGFPGDTFFPTTGYGVQINDNASAGACFSQIYKFRPVSDATLNPKSAGVTQTLTAGTLYKIRLQRSGNVVRYRIWAAAGTEPGTWAESWTDTGTVLTGGKVLLTFSNGGDGAQRSATFDDVTVTDDGTTARTGTVTGTWGFTGTIIGGTPADISGLDLHTDFQGKADGAPPAVGDEGSPVVITPVNDLSVSAGRLVHGTLTAADPARYWQQTLPGVSRVGGEFQFSADTGSPGSGSVSLLTTGDQAGTRVVGVHLVVTPLGWTFGVIGADSALDVLASGTFDPPLAQDWTPGGAAGTVHRAEADVYGDTVVIRLPDGSMAAVSDPRIADYPRDEFLFEFFRNAATGPTMAGVRLWADGVARPLDYTTVVDGSAPAGWWRGDGSTADETGGTPGTLVGDATYGPSVVPALPAAQAFSFDGSGDEVTVPDQAKLNHVAEFTAEAWFAVDTVGAPQVIVTKSPWTLYVSAAGVVTANLISVESVDTLAVAAGSLNHAAVTVDDTEYRLYVNGELRFTGARPDLTASAVPLRIGTLDGATYPLAGRVGEVAYYDRALSGGEVTEHYLAGSQAGEGAVTGTWGFTGTAVGRRTPKASVAGAWGFTGAAAGRTDRAGTVTGAWGFAGAAAGRRTPKATVAGAWEFTGTATGQAPPDDTASGALAGTWGFTGAAQGRRTPKATLTGAWGFTGAAAGTTTRTGSVTGAWGFTGSAVGASPTVEARYSTWDGSEWQPTPPLVWDGTTWRDDIPVTITT